MLIFGEFFKKQSDKKIHQNAPNCTTNFSHELANAPESLPPPPPPHMRVTIIVHIIISTYMYK